MIFMINREELVTLSIKRYTEKNPYKEEEIRKCLEILNYLNFEQTRMGIKNKERMASSFKIKWSKRQYEEALKRSKNTYYPQLEWGAFRTFLHKFKLTLMEAFWLDWNYELLKFIPSGKPLEKYVMNIPEGNKKYKTLREIGFSEKELITFLSKWITITPE